MRTIAGIFLIFFINLSSGFAQTFSAEVSAGVTASQIDGDDLGGYNKAGFIGGGGVSIPLDKDRWRLKLEMFFIQKGSRATEQDHKDLNWRSNYIEIPLVVDFFLTERFYLTGGLAADLLINSKADVTGSRNLVDNSDVMERFNPVSVFGLGYKLSDTFAFNARNLYSLTSISKFERNYNNVIAVYLSVNL